MTVARLERLIRDVGGVNGDYIHAVIPLDDNDPVDVFRVTINKSNEVNRSIIYIAPSSHKTEVLWS